METMSKRELDTLARFAHDLGHDNADDQECTQEQIEQIGQAKLERLRTVLSDEQIGRLFVANFVRGWRFAETDSREWEGRVLTV